MKPEMKESATRKEVKNSHEIFRKHRNLDEQSEVTEKEGKVKH
jgi:hypothetical protein